MTQDLITELNERIGRLNDQMEEVHASSIEHTRLSAQKTAYMSIREHVKASMDSAEYAHD